MTVVTTLRSVLLFSAVPLLASILSGCAAATGEEADDGTDALSSSGPSIAELERAAATELAAEEAAHPEVLAAPDAAPADPRSLATILGRGTWSYAFILVGADGTRRTVASSQTSRSMFGASSFKLFTGWTAHKAHAVTPELIATTLRPSDNAKANAIMCQNGATLAGTHVACHAADPPTAAMRLDLAVHASVAQLEGEGVKLSTAFHMVDGSGKDSADKLTVDDLTNLLLTIAHDADGRSFRKLLPRPGVGTLDTFFANFAYPLQAKTGTYVVTANGVKALSGFVDLPAGTLVFSVVGNGVGDPIAALGRIEKAVRKEVREIQDVP